ncbi:MAG: TolC family protein [Candidatus Latescibacterota bacterium]
MPRLHPSHRLAAVLAPAVLILALAGAPAALEGPLTLERAVRLALERSNGLRRLDNQVAQARTSVSQARAQSRPDLSLSVAPSERLGRTFEQSIGRVENQRSEGLSLRASSSLTLFNGFANQAGVQAARLDLNASQQELRRGHQAVAYETVSRFLAVFSTAEVVRVRQQSVEAQKQQLARIRAYHEQGTRSRADVLQQEASLASAELTLADAQRSREVALLDLRQVLRLDLSEPLQPVAPDLAGPRQEPAAWDATGITREALAERPDLEAQRLRIDAARQQLRRARATGLPALSLSASGGTSYSSLNRISGFGEQLADLNPSASVGLSLSFSPFDQERTQSAVTSATLALRNAELTLESGEQDLARSIQQAVLDYSAAWQRRGAAQAQRAAAAEALAAMEARYSTGAATFVELSQTRALHVEAEATWVESAYALALARLAVAYHQGGQAWTAALGELTGLQAP